MDNNYIDKDFLIISIVIQAHGKVIKLDLDPETTKLFENVRLLCKAGDFVDYNSTPAEEFNLYSGLNAIFSKDLDVSTYNILKQTRSGILVDNITYDKTISLVEGDPGIFHYVDPINYLQGVYLLSIHQEGKLIYPNEKQVINFMNLKDLQIIADLFKTKLPNLNDLSTPFPNFKLFLEEEETIKRNNILSEKEKEKKIEEIRRQFYGQLDRWQLTIEGNKIVTIKLSVLVELIKTIMGKNIFINILDYSCNSKSMFIPKEQNLSSQYALKESDIETGINKRTEYGGKRIKKKKRVNKTNKKKKHLKKWNKSKKKY